MDYSVAVNSPAQSGQDEAHGAAAPGAGGPEDMELDVHNGDFPMDLDQVDHEAEALPAAGQDDDDLFPIPSPKGHLAGSSDQRGDDAGAEAAK